MPKRKKAKIETEYITLCAKLTSYTANVSAAINHEIDDSWRAQKESPIFRFDSGLELSGIITYPEERQGAALQIGV